MTAEKIYTRCQRCKQKYSVPRIKELCRACERKPKPSFQGPFAVEINITRFLIMQPAEQERLVDVDDVTDGSNAMDEQ